MTDHKNIEALRAVGNNPTPTTALHSEPLLTDEAKFFAKVVPEVYHNLFDVFSRGEAKNMPPCREFDHQIPHASVNIYCYKCNIICAKMAHIAYQPISHASVNILCYKCIIICAKMAHIAYQPISAKIISLRHI